MQQWILHKGHDSPSAMQSYWAEDDYTNKESFIQLVNLVKKTEREQPAQQGLPFSRSFPNRGKKVWIRLSDMCLKPDSEDSDAIDEGEQEDVMPRPLLDDEIADPEEGMLQFLHKKNEALGSDDESMSDDDNKSDLTPEQKRQIETNRIRAQRESVGGGVPGLTDECSPESILPGVNLSQEGHEFGPYASPEWETEAATLTEQEEKKIADYVGQRVAKKFKGVTCMGTVQKHFLDDELLWKIQYDNGDDEDVDRSELLEAIDLYDPWMESKLRKRKRCNSQDSQSSDDGNLFGTKSSNANVITPHKRILEDSDDE